MSLGKKYVCFKCKTKFYDLNKPDPLCPKCGADQRDDPNPDPQEQILAKYKRPGSESSRASKRAPVEEGEEDEEIDDEFLEDADPGLDEDEEDFGDLDEEPEDEPEEDYE